VFVVASRADNPPSSQPVRHFDAEPPMTIDPAKKYTATFDTAKGKIVCELFAKDAPHHVNSFVFLCRNHFYDGLNFHRWEPGFVVQGGDPAGNGSGGCGYTLPLEAQDNPHLHDAGA